MQLNIDKKANFQIANIITNDDRHKLIDLYNSLNPRFAEQDYNLNLVDKRQLKVSDWNEQIRKIDKFSGRETYSHYFVMYKPGSFTRLHTDNADDVGLTIVTMIDSVDLVGGETLVLVPNDPDDPNIAKRKHKQGSAYKKGNLPKGQAVVPKIVQCDVGQSMVYDRNLTHGVTYVEEGLRLVLVSWYKR